jgi:hypothetical protein
MPPRLLIINCTSPFFFYIPMGSFGLCDALGQQGLEARIFNPALYPEAEVRQRLFAVLDTLQPTHVGLVCHWQETAHGLLAALEMVRAWDAEVVTLCGGFTASYFAEELLRTVTELDYVVVGDPEVPVTQLLLGSPPAAIANLVWRENGASRRSEGHWLMEQPLFDSLAFADCSCLVDAPRYFEKINTKLGFPVLLGRGCVFDCEYCGGSRHAFQLHSGRTKPVTRSLAAILADLHRLKAQTSVLYICYENDPAFIKSLFRAIGEDRELRGHFTLHYGAWHLLDAEFLALYRQAFNCAAVPPIFEFSPEVVADHHRSAIKRGVTYGFEAMEENFRAISEAFNGRVRIEVFFSRYHPAISVRDLEREIGAILLLKHRMIRQGLPVHVCFDHLSTDVGSRYWEAHQERPRDFARFLDLKARVDAGHLYPFPVDNLCLLIPAHLPSAFLVRHEALLLVLERLEHHCHELVLILLACMEDRWLEVLEAVLGSWLDEQPAGVFFAEPPLGAIVEELGQRLLSSPLPCPSFLADLFRFSRKKLALSLRIGSPRLASAPPDERLILDPARISIHEQDYLDLLPLLRRLQENKASPLPYQRTACLFLDSGIFAIPHGFYRSTLRLFEQPRTLESYLAALRSVPRIDMQQHENLLDRLIKEEVLRPASYP